MGQRGSAGPKESCVKTTEGIYGFACVEGARPWFLDIVPADGKPHPKFAAAVSDDLLRLRTLDGKHDVILGVRREFPEFYMPKRSLRQYRDSARFWMREYNPAEKTPASRSSFENPASL